MTKTIEQLAQEYRDAFTEEIAAQAERATLERRLPEVAAADTSRGRRFAAADALHQAAVTGAGLAAAATAYRDAWREERASEYASVRRLYKEAEEKFARARGRRKNLMYDLKGMVTEPVYTFDVPLKTNAEGYCGGSEGYATMTFRRPVIITKLVAKCRAEMFRLTSFKFGDKDDATDLFAGFVEGIPAENFYESVPANSFHAPTLHEGEPVTVKFRDERATTVPEKIELIVTVRSPYERAEVLGEQE